MATSSYHRDYNYYHYKLPYTSKVLVWSLLLWFVGLSSFLLLLLHYSSNPFTNSPSLHLSSSNANSCDLAIGKWVREETKSRSTYPYSNTSCRSMPESKNCEKYGKDMDYLNWRWKPDGCEMKRFDAGLFLEIVRGKKMGFVGDSLARNQFDSLVCLLSQVESPIDMYKDKDDRFRTWFFPSHNFTLMILWTRFLVQAEERTINNGSSSSSSSGVFDLQLDKIESSWTDDLPTIDIIVISTGHWFFRKNYLYEGGKLLGCIFCSEPNIPSLNISFSIQKAVRSALGFLNNCKDCGEHVTLLRTFSPAHFENGAWNGGGYCNRTRPMSDAEVETDTLSTHREISRVQMEEVHRLKKNGGKGRRFDYLDVTRPMLMRGDAHPGSHWNNEWMKGYSDCVHWCLPGPVDLWNDLLLAAMEKIVSPKG